MSPTNLFALVSLMLAPLALAGLALIHQGLGRSRSAAHTMLATMCAISIASVAFLAVGASIAGTLGGPHHLLFHAVDYAGAGPLLTMQLSPRTIADQSFDSSHALPICFYLIAVTLCAIIPISAASDRWRLGAVCASTAVLAGLIWPLVAHWAWVALNFPNAIDGGAGVIHMLGGLAALSAVWILGPRRGKYSHDGIATAIPGHNIVQVLAGCLSALVGFVAISAAAQLILFIAPPEHLVLILPNTLLGAAGGCLGALVTTRLRYRKPDATISANGWIAGIVSVSASPGLLDLWAALLIGLVAGLIVAYSVELLELRLLIDDPGGAISVHGAAGAWGLIAPSLFAGAYLPYGWTGRLFEVAFLLGIIFPLLHGANLILNRFVPFRVDRDGDWQGMDIRELGAGAYPEFVVHADEFIPR